MADPIDEKPRSRGVALVDTTAPDLSNVLICDRVTGETLDRYPGELILVDDVEGHYSHSFIRKYSSCHAAGFFNKQKVQTRPSFALERGSLIHAAIEAAEKNDADPYKVLEERWKLNILDNFDQFRPTDQKKVEKGYEETKRMLDEWLYVNLANVRALVRPEDVEVEFNLPVEIMTDRGSFKRRFLGKLDLVLWNSDRTAYRIYDYKTGAKAPTEEELTLDTQFTLYQWAATQMYGMPPQKMFYYFLMGENNTGTKFSPSNAKTQSNPRHPDKLDYALPVPMRSGREIADYFNNYAAGAIVGYESGIVSKNGKSDPKMCARCEYKPHCDTANMPLPRFARVA
jgi:hypothetical protein